MIEVWGVSKRFGRVLALEGVDAQFPPGAVTALVGPNGSGKTTLIKILLGLVRPDRGQVMVAGHRLDGTPFYRRTVGYMAQVVPFPENLTPSELFRLVADLRKSSAGVEEDLVERFGLGAHLQRPLRVLSGGTRQKVNAVLALSFQPTVLVLDEPTAGLDPVAAGILKARIQKERARGTTVLITSHLLGEVEEMADRIAFLLDGRLRFNGTQRELFERTGARRLERAVAALMVENESREVA